MSVPYLVSQNIPKPVPITPSSAAISGLSDKGRDAISAAQIAHPEYYHNNFRDAFNSLTNRVKDSISKGVSVNLDDLTKPKVTSYTGGHSASEVYSAPVTPAQLDYLNAELASYYGMSKETAYQEALSNTAYQRSVKDMQAAGLNPAVIYGAGKGSPADGVYYVSSDSPRRASGGSSGYSGSSGRSSGSSKNNGKLFTTGEFYGLSAAAGLVSAVVSRNPNAYWIGQTVAQGFMTAANSLLRK